MAAPITVYSTNKLPVSGSTSTTLPLALNLDTYPNLKGTFFLDKVFRVEDDFIGMVKSGSTMYSYHNSNRFSKLRAKDESTGEVYLLCNDGGLNTLPFTREEVEAGNFIFDLKAEARFNSSFYSSTTNYGFRGRQRNTSNTGWESWNQVSQTGENGVIAPNDYIVIQSYGFGSERKSMEFEIQPFATNEEGTYYGDSVLIMPKAKAVTFYGDPTIFYIDTPDVGIGTKLYQTEDFGSHYNGSTGTMYLGIAPLKYWIYGYDVFADDYMVIEYRDDTVVVPVTPPYLDYIAWSETSAGDAINQVIYDLRYHSGRLWFDAPNDLWFENWSDSSGFYGVPLDGWYANGDVSGVNQMIYIISGVPQPI